MILMLKALLVRTSLRLRTASPFYRYNAVSITLPGLQQNR